VKEPLAIGFHNSDPRSRIAQTISAPRAQLRAESRVPRGIFHRVRQQICENMVQQPLSACISGTISPARKSIGHRLSVAEIPVHEPPRESSHRQQPV
jgi:hypothetical protein